MEFYDVVEKRHTIRQFDNREVEPEKIEPIKKAVRCPENYEVPVIIGIGYAKENAEIPRQYEFRAKEKIHIDKF